jgi:hypothetical protein
MRPELQEIGSDGDEDGKKGNKNKLYTAFITRKRMNCKGNKF